MFRFNQFTIADDRCAQKVGTDGVLLGAWAELGESRRILDIGTGSGLIALMVAQRCAEAQVTGVEVVPEAATQARENAERSPFAERLNIVASDVRDFQTSQLFDCILCNPPFFTEDTLPPDASRALARHSALLGFPQLVAAANRLLTSHGSFHVILPCSSDKDFVTQCIMSGFVLMRRCLVRTVERKPPQRSLLSLMKCSSSLESLSFPPATQEMLTLMDGQGNRSLEYSRLTKDFYL